MLKDFEYQLRSIFSPEEITDIVEWLEKNVHSIPYSPIPGAFRVQETPWIAEPLRACTDPENKLVALMAPIQSGKSTTLELLSCYIVAKMPGPSLFLQDIDPNAKDWHDSRLLELWKNCPPVQQKVNVNASRKEVTVFDRMRLYTLGAHNKKNLQRRSIRWLVGDEVWLWPRGHISQARSRVEFFGWLGKCIFASQGGVEGDEWTELFNSTDRREWTFACPDCGTRQPFSWEQIRYPEGYKSEHGYNFRLIETATTYRCCNCDKEWKDNPGSRAEMNATGQYVAMNENAVKGNVGYHWNALATRSWGDLAVQATKAKEASVLYADEEPRKLFKQKQLALPWSDEPDDFDLNAGPGEYKMGENWDDEAVIYDRVIYPAGEKAEECLKKGGCRLRVMGVDVQNNGYYFVIRMYSSDGRSRLYKWGFVTTLNELIAVQTKSEVHPSMVCMDSGFKTDDVYRLCAQMGYIATKGSAINEFPWRVTRSGKTFLEYRSYKPPQTINYGKKCKLVLFSNLALKDTLARLKRSGHNSYSIDAGDEYDRQMSSEVRSKTPSGKPEWKLVGNKANHIWDCEVMCLLPAIMLKLVGRGAKKVQPESTLDTQPEGDSLEADQQ